MNCVSQLLALFNADISSIDERKLSVSSNITLDVSEIPNYDELVSIINAFPNRDEICVDFSDDCDNTMVLKANHLTTNAEYDKFINNAEYCQSVSVTITIDKKIEDNKLSIYCYEKFVEDLLSLSEEEAMLLFSKFFEDRNYLIFTLFDSDIIFKTKTMCFVSETNADTIEINSFNRLNRLKECHQASYFVNATSYELIPDDFSIDVDFNNNSLSTLFKRLNTILSLIYISNSSSLSSNLLNIKISGQKVLENSYYLSEVRYNNEIYRIYSWIYTDGNPIDKGILAKNIISLHCRYMEIVDIDSKTMDSIQSNYNLYLRDNVSQYIELKNKLSEFINDIVAKTGDMSLEILDKLKNNLIAIFVFLFSVVLTNIVASQEIDHIFSKDITFVLELVLCFSMGYVLVCLLEVNYKIRKNKDAYSALKNNYRSVFTQEDLDEAFGNDKLMDDANKEVHRKSNIFASIWLALLVLMYLIIEMYSPNPILFSLFK